MANSYTTPEEYLARNIRKEIRKEESKDYKKKSRHVGFSETPIFVGSSDFYPTLHFSTQPVISVTLGPNITQEISVETRYFPQNSQQTSRQENYTMVPPEFAARGIKPAKAKSYYDLSRYEKCKVPECNIKHSRHYCNVCEKLDVSHSEINCPIRNRRYY